MEHNVAAAENGDYTTMDHSKDKEDTPVSPASAQKVGAGSLKTRCIYGVFLLLGFVLALVTRNEYIQYITKWMIEHDTGCTDTTCIGNQGAYRISFALFTFFMVHWILSSRCNLCMSSEQKISFNNGSFFWKVIAFIPLLIISFVIPNPFFVVYAWFSIFASILFLLAQLVILLDFSYNWSEKWAASEERRYQVGLVVCAVLLYLVSLVVIGLLYHWFAPDSSCQLSIGLITGTLILAVLYTFASVVVSHGSIIPAGTVFLYTSWTCYSALASGVPPGQCNTLAPTTTGQIIIGIVICAVSMVYTCINAANSRQSFQLTSDDEDPEHPVNLHDKEASNFTFFHAIMMLGSCYMAMLITGWTISGNNGTGIADVDSGAAPMWVKFSAEVVCVLMYLWTLVAPGCCGGREFN